MTFFVPMLARFPRLAALTLTTAAALSACGGGSSTTPDPLASFKQQKLDWQACDPTILRNDTTYFDQLGERAKCALMRAPLDYANPDKGELKVALLRVAAARPDQRSGAILINPGGPGEDGLVMAPLIGTLWDDADPGSPNGRMMKELEARYDLIGFSPRGVGASTTLTCSSNERMAVENNLSFDRSPANIAAAQHNARLIAQTCAKNPLTPYINSDATARDMDLLRTVLGDEKINYLGYSYGTWLGAWYASLFPERVGHMLLDSNMNVTATFDEARLGTTMGRQRAIDQVMLPYAARHPERFNLGSSASDLGAALLQLPADLKSQLPGFLEFYKQARVDRGIQAMMAAVGLQQLRTQLPDADEQQLHDAIEQHTFSASADNTIATAIAHGMTQNLFRPPVPTGVGLDPSSAVYQAVICNDTGTRGDEQHWVEVGDQYASLYPLTGGGETSNPCLYWGGPVVQRPALTNAAALPILLLQSRFDAATPLEGAEQTLAGLPGARMVLVEDEYTHALYPYGDNCVDTSVLEYFSTGKQPASGASCTGKPLPGDSPAAGAANKTMASSYTDPARAAAIMEKIHQITARHNGDR